jgi:hypothetical protein
VRIIGADICWDGGTVVVDIEEQGVAKRLTFDYKLPWDGRPRHVSVTEGGSTRVVPIGSEEEAEICLKVKGQLELEYGAGAVRESLDQAPAREVAWKAYCAEQKSFSVSIGEFVDPNPLPFRGFWHSVFCFVEKAHREGKI